MKTTAIVCSWLFLILLTVKGQDTESIPLADNDTESDDISQRILSLQDRIAKELGEDVADLDDESELERVDSSRALKDRLPLGDVHEFDTRGKSRERGNKRSKPPAPPRQKTSESKMKGRVDDMLPISKEKEVRTIRHARSHRVGARDLRDTKTITKRGRRRRQQDWWPTSVGVDLDLMADHPNDEMRPGQATNSHSCDKVRSIPSSLKNSNFYNNGINSFYKKYTEAYGIPVIGSSNVTDEGMKRACYVLRLLLASRYDVRQAYYKMFGRIALIGDGEEQTSLYEYSTWDSNYWDKRARGLGGTFHIPICSAGDDNTRCKAKDRYFDQDILVHEFSHGVHKLAATLVIEGFEMRLDDTYQEMVKARGKWAGTYAAKNSNEYFAVASQFYFHAFRGPGKYLTLGKGVYDRESLRDYDPHITSLLDEVHPCSIQDNTMIHRCDWKLNNCGIGNFVLKYDLTYLAKSNCPVLKTLTRDTAEGCAIAACYYRANVFNWKGKTCTVVRCASTSQDDLKIVQSKGTFYVYKATSQPVMDLKQEERKSIKMHCTRGPYGTKRCSGISKKKRCGTSSVTKGDCKNMGCCWDGSMCHYAKQECVDTSIYCHEWARDFECERNPGFMYRKCQVACDLCNDLNKLDMDELNAMCQDKDPYCPEWAKSGECQENPTWMKRNCAISCNTCKGVYDPLKRF